MYCNALRYFVEKPAIVCRKRERFHSGNLLPELLRTSYLNPNTVMVAKKVFATIGLFNETRYYPEDWEMWLKIALAGFEFGYLVADLVMVEWRRDSNTMMENQWIFKRHAVEMFTTMLPRWWRWRGDATVSTARCAR